MVWLKNPSSSELIIPKQFTFVLGLSPLSAENLEFSSSDTPVYSKIYVVIPLCDPSGF